jgi:hypothetical protein
MAVGKRAAAGPGVVILGITLQEILYDACRRWISMLPELH